ncbi:hypothetical protein NCAS_0D02850 [Naumovozyma castellii]|uniref:Uncharacterized protein n=1 Tax=Naumovozyma castellii TaxID=27288 RepID=G0VE75_NAUCA|nr:hypothetical protein NCAS_0D02850 [Naumovozyma castellii CBS 4309]CCC69866.1 hypothetical protein NCAS_0D02850 [Naumovozyma castellii CBS 4309]
MKLIIVDPSTCKKDDLKLTDRESEGVAKALKRNKRAKSRRIKHNKSITFQRYDPNDPFCQEGGHQRAEHRGHEESNYLEKSSPKYLLKDPLIIKSDPQYKSNGAVLLSSRRLLNTIEARNMFHLSFVNTSKQNINSLENNISESLIKQRTYEPEKGISFYLKDQEEEMVPSFVVGHVPKKNGSDEYLSKSGIKKVAGEATSLNSPDKNSAPTSISDILPFKTRIFDSNTVTTTRRLSRVPNIRKCSSFKFKLIRK